MRVFLTALAMFAAACATTATTQAQVSAPLAAEEYVIDPAHTQVAFSIERFGFNFVLGRFDNLAGTIMLDQANPERSSVTATIQVASISSGNTTRDEHLRGERWLDAARFPTMNFRSTAVRRTGENAAEVRGDLTLHGVTAPVTLNVTMNQIGLLPNNQRPGVGFSATGVLSRAAFGLNTAPNLIGDEVRITIEALGQAPQTSTN